MKILNPSTGEVIREIPEDSKQSIQDKFSRARLAQKDWAYKTLEERVLVIQKWHDLLQKNIETFAKELSLEMGKPLQEAKNEINGACARTRFFIENASKWLKEEKVRQDGNTAEVISHEALGVIVNISAWNYPFLVGVNVFIPALLCGNAVLYKPSEFATLTGLNIAKAMKEAGVSDDIFTPVIGAREAGEVLLDLDANGYFFTGSYKTGKFIAEKVAHKLVPVGLELGGKDPLYVTDEVDVAKAAGAVVEGCFYNNGQSCCAVERVYVHERVYEDFVKYFLEETQKLKVGNPLEGGNTQGAIARPVHIEFLNSQIKDAVSKGAKVVAGGKKASGAGAFFEPTVLVNVNHTMNLMKLETFGPVIGIQKVRDDREAISLMQDCEYGLTASVYSKNSERAKSILQQVDSGTSYINCCDRVSPYLPWSGRKHSGLGATLSYLGILAFTKPRAWHLRT